jgi:outer membrane receptor protein involved in Fe transport
LDGDVDITEDNGSGPVPVDLPVSDTRVEERRVDASARQIWRVTDTLTVDTTLAVEFSEIAQTGDAEQERTFTYFKPAFNAIWTPSDANQFSLSLTRTVGQLSFGEFISSVNVNDDTTNLGNPNLEPERTWRLQADWERRFWEEGTLTLLMRHEWVDAVADVVPLGFGSEGPGNLGDGTRLRFQGNLDLPTDRLGIPGGLLSLGGMFRETQVTDPITGLERRFRNDEDWRWSADFRQDLPQLGFAWGVDYNVQGAEDFYRTSRFERVTPPRGNIDVFVERRFDNGLTAQVGADLNLGTRDRERFDWPVSRADGFPTEIERRSVNDDGVLYFEVSGVF